LDERDRALGHNLFIPPYDDEKVVPLYRQEDAASGHTDLHAPREPGGTTSDEEEPSGPGRAHRATLCRIMVFSNFTFQVILLAPMGLGFHTAAVFYVSHTPMRRDFNFLDCSFGLWVLVHSPLPGCSFSVHDLQRAEAQPLMILLYHSCTATFMRSVPSGHRAHIHAEMLGV
jgi:hypothetical protein